MATYYVRPDGSDSNPGTGPLTSQAFATIGKALTLTVTADIVWVSPGYHYCNEVVPTNYVNDPCYIKGDPTCTVFTDMTKGDVKIGAAPTEGGVATAAFPISTISKLEYCFSDIIFFQGTQYCLKLESQSVLTRCTFYGAIYDENAAVSTFNRYNYCIFYNFRFEGIVAGFYRCIIYSLDLIHIDPGAYSPRIEFTHCYVVINKIQFYNNTNTWNNLRFYGCKIIMSSKGWECGINFATSATINQVLDMDGCDISGGTIIQDYDGDYATRVVDINIRGCYIHSCIDFMPVFDGYNITDIEYNFFKNIRQVFTQYLTAGIYKTVSNNYAENVQILSYESQITFSYWVASNVSEAPDTYNNFSHNAILESQRRGWFPTTVDALTGDVQSLKIKGHTYAPIHIFWIECQANVPTTVFFKYRRTDVSNTRTKGAQFVLGTTVVSASKITTSEQSISVTYTHYKTELVPLIICPDPQSVSDYEVIGQIQTIKG